MSQVYPGKHREFISDYQQFSIPCNAADVTPSDTADLTYPGILFIGDGGDLVVDLVGTGTGLTFQNLRDGQEFPHLVKRVYATGTTCTNIKVCY